MQKPTKLSDLIPDPKNANKGTLRGATMIEDSLRTYGAGRSILIDKNRKIIAGNKTVEQAGAIGIEDVVIIPSDGTKLIAVQRTDLDLEHDKAAKELAIADNRAGQVSLDWDGAILAELENQIDLSKFFDDKELEAILSASREPEEVPEPQIDRAEELREKWQTESGQIWEIPAKGPSGKAHRLMCGDSASQADVERLLGKARPFLMVCDPPYGVEYDPHWRDDVGEFFRAPAIAGPIANDERVDWSAAWHLSPCAVAYVWHAGVHAAEVALSLLREGFEIRNQIVWAKPSLVMSRGHYHWQHEPCWYAVRKGQTSRWCGDRKQSTLWEIAGLNPIGRQEERFAHATQKPVECMARPIKNHASPEVYEPFAGSGTTICAAEQNGRLCYAMEIDPKYVAVSLERLSDMGLDPRMVNHG